MDLVEKIKILHNHLTVKNFPKVIEGAQKILKKNPNNPYVLNLAGMAHQGLYQHKVSIKCFQDSLRLDPNNIAAMNNLANSYKALGKLEYASEFYEKTLKINPNYINGLNNFANLKILTNKYKEAINLLDKALQISKNKSPTQNQQIVYLLFSIASAYQSIGKIEETKDNVKNILQIDPTHSSSHKLLSEIYKYDNNDKESLDHIENMLQLLKQENLNIEKEIDFSFALGKAYEDLKDYENSFKYLKKGNKLKNEKFRFNLENEKKLFLSLKKSFQDVDFRNYHKNFSSKKIIFICGMPRSGTTLVEQILSTHNEVYGAGELIYLQEIIKEQLLKNNEINISKLKDFISSPQNILNDTYFRNLSLYKIKENIITDKAPQNFRWIGFIKIFFPNSKILHCYRNPKDNCLSLFKNNFASASMNWSYDENNIAAYYNLYKDLINFWKEKIPNFIYDVNYESLVKDKEKKIKEIINFCDLDWDTRCLQPHKNSKTPIKTVSINQARKEIYKSSLNSYSNYSKYLNKMFEALEN